MAKHTHHSRPSAGPSQRQLRAGELVRHALVDILRQADPADEAIKGVLVTVSEVRMSPDLKHALVFVEPLGGDNAATVVSGLNRVTRYLRGQLGRVIEMRFTPELKFVHDDSFDAAERMKRLLDDPRVRRDVEAPSDPEGG